MVADGSTLFGNETAHHALLVLRFGGTFLAKWGRQGEGPGEFGWLGNWAGLYRGDSIAALDRSEHAIEIYSHDGRFARRLSLSRNRTSKRPPAR